MSEEIKKTGFFAKTA
jgi:hypothetical protein